MKCRVYIDGAARGNPGPAGIGVVIYVEGEEQPRREVYGYLGEATNNEAEYKAMLRAFEELIALSAQEIILYSDSQLLVRQMLGEYKVRHERLRPLYEKAQEYAQRFSSVQCIHIPREKNREADALANRGIDGS